MIKILEYLSSKYIELRAELSRAITSFENWNLDFLIYNSSALSPLQGGIMYRIERSFDVGCFVLVMILLCQLGAS